MRRYPILGAVLASAATAQNVSVAGAGLTAAGRLRAVPPGSPSSVRTHGPLIKFATSGNAEK